MKLKPLLLLAALLFMPSFAVIIVAPKPVIAAQAFVQSKKNIANTQNNTVEFDSDTVSGRLIVVCVPYWVDTLLSVTDNKSNTYTHAVTQTHSSATLKASIYYAQNITGGAGHQVTANFDATANGGIAVHEYSGMETSGVPGIPTPRARQTSS